MRRPGNRVNPSFARTAFADVWTLSVEVAAIGVSLLAVIAYQRRATLPFVVTVGVTGGGLAVLGIVAADPWFPWEQAPTRSGLLHALAMVSTLGALGSAMVQRPHALPRRWLVARDRSIERAFGVAALGSLLSVGSLRMRGQPLHWFGLCERVLLVIALARCASLAFGRRIPSKQR